jgi:hypothetical protein
MQEIKVLYEAPDDTLCDKPWMKKLVKYLKRLKEEDWANSIDDLPDTELRVEDGEMDDDVLLLWKDGTDFLGEFFP